MRKSVKKKYTNSIGAEFVLISAGSFIMGSYFSLEEINERDGEYSVHRYEHPQHKVTIGQPYYLQTTPVTQWQGEMNGLGDVVS